MKYEIGAQTVTAVYDNAGTQNPLIEALPEELEPDTFFRHIRSFPSPPAVRSYAERKRALALIPAVFVPLDYLYGVYDGLFRMLQSSYHTLTSKESVQRINAIFASDGAAGAYGTQAQSGALLGTPGLGKTTGVKRCLRLMPQVIAHEKYLGNTFYTKQVLWLFVECPSDASQKTMAYNIIRALDMAVGGNHLDYIQHTRSTATSTVATYIKVLCMTYHVGLLVIDEIQNVVSTAQRTNRVKPLIRFLTELTNDTCTAVYFVGTSLADNVFQSEEYLRRRTRGPRLLPFKPDAAYRDFLRQLWPYQFTAAQAELTDKLANQLYDYSGGIPAYIARLFEEAQAQALTMGMDKIDGKLIAHAADYLAIQPPRELGRGAFISDFRQSDADIAIEPEVGEPTRRLYAVKRGRKAAERDEADLIAAYKAGTLTEMLRSHNLLEVLVLC